MKLPRQTVQSSSISHFVRPFIRRLSGRTLAVAIPFLLLFTGVAWAQEIRIDPVSLTFTYTKSGAPAEKIASRQLKSRPAVLKPTTTRLTGSDRRDVIAVKFRDGHVIRARDGQLTDMGSKALQSANGVLARFSTGAWLRADRLPEKQIDALRENAEQNLGKRLPDLNLQFNLRLPPGMDAATAIDLLNTLDIVELAQPIPKLVELPKHAQKSSPPSGAISLPAAPNLESFQGYLNDAPIGIGAKTTWNSYGTRGAGIGLTDVEFLFNTTHADLPTVTIVGPTPGDPGSGNNHATAVLGEVAAKNDGVGTTGIASDCTVYFASSYVNNDYDLSGALTNALSVLDTGDVILVEQQIGGPNGSENFVPVEWYKPYYDRIVVAVGNGVSVVEAGANGGEDLDAAIYSTGNGGHYPFLLQNDSGAIMVGAGSAPPAFGGSSTARSRLYFSDYGARLNVQGWGEAVTTTGYGDAYSSEGDNRLYTYGFNGTSSASPIVAGACVLIQAARVAENGTPFSPASLRQLLISTGSAQQNGDYPTSQHIGPLPDVPTAISTFVDLPDPNQFVIYNEGGATLQVTGIAPSTSAPWIQVSPPAPFNIAPSENTMVTVNIDWAQVPAGQRQVRLLVASNDADENPYPNGVYITTNYTPETITQPGKPSGNTTPALDEAYEYTTTTSTSNLGHPIEYSFDWGDGTNSAWYEGSSAAQAWSTAGQKIVHVTARCKLHPQIFSTSAGLTVEVIAPEVISTPGTPSGETDLAVGQEATYTTTGATSDLGHTVQYQFNWGDGSTSAWSTAKSAAHAYSSGGVRLVSVTARCMQHNDKSSTSAGLQVTVTAAESLSQPGTPEGESQLNTGQSYTFTTQGATSSAGHPLEYRFTWGDGSTSEWSTSTSAAHIWNLPGQRSITVTARCQLHPAYTSTSTAKIVVVKSGAVRVDWPNGGETWTAGTKKVVKWATGPAGCSNVKIELWRNGTYYRTLNASTPNDGKQKCKLPLKAKAGSVYKIRITCLTNASNTDESDAPFTVVK